MRNVFISSLVWMFTHFWWTETATVKRRKHLSLGQGWFLNVSVLWHFGDSLIWSKFRITCFPLDAEAQKAGNQRALLILSTTNFLFVNQKGELLAWSWKSNLKCWQFHLKIKEITQNYYMVTNKYMLIDKNNNQNRLQDPQFHRSLSPSSGLNGNCSNSHLRKIIPTLKEEW